MRMMDLLSLVRRVGAAPQLAAHYGLPDDRLTRQKQKATARCGRWPKEETPGGRIYPQRASGLTRPVNTTKMDPVLPCAVTRPI
jgi:hypothetical protein